jgi:sister chromatid cohesion protein DCC1
VGGRARTINERPADRNKKQQEVDARGSVYGRGEYADTGLGHGLGHTPFVVATVGADIDLSARAAGGLVWDLPAPECFVCGEQPDKEVAIASRLRLELRLEVARRGKEQSQQATMSSQPTAGTPFSVAADLQPCRLLELPPDLLEYLSTSDAPTVSFKARDATDPEAFLTTNHKTYLIRQVHTSNTLYLTAPSHNAPGTTAISQCRSALECLPAPVRHAESTLRSLLIPFAEPQDMDVRPSNPRSKNYVFAHTPMSHDECQAVWTDLVAFEHSGQSFRPTAAALAKVWKWLVEIAYASAVNLAEPVQKDAIDKMLDGEDEWPRTLVDAIFMKLSADHPHLLQLHQQTTVKWVGSNTLESHRPNSKQSFMDTSLFLEAWKDALPETWRPDVSLDMLKASSSDRNQPTQLTFPQGLYKLSGGGKRIEFVHTQSTHAEEATAGAPKPSATTTAGKRKWHEKFAAVRKQGKPS